MYNEELKERFVAEFSTNAGRKALAVGMFDALQKHEEQWGRDFCTMPAEEITPVVGDLIGLRGQSQKTRLVILKQYVRWCLSNNVEGARDDLLLIEDFGLDKMRKQMVSNPGHLQRYLNCICAPENEHTIDNVFRCYYWLAYAGLKSEDAFNVMASDVDFSLMVVNHNGVEYPIYREAIPAFRECVENLEFQYKHPNYTKEVWKPRAVGGELLRGITESKSIKAMRVEMSRRQAKQKYRPTGSEGDASLDLRLSYYRVGLSGLFYRMYEAERAGMPPDFTDAAAWFMEGKEYHLESGRNLIGAKQRQVASSYMRDYLRWKEAFAI